MKRFGVGFCIGSLLISGCASNVQRAPSVTPIAASDLAAVRRFPENEVVFARGESRKRVAHEALALSRGSEPPRLILAGEELDLPVGSKPPNKAGGYGWSALFILAGAALIASGKKEEPQPRDEEQTDPVALGALTGGLGLLGLFGTARQRRNAVRYAEAESRPMEVSEGPFKYVIRAKVLYKWTGGSREVERVQVRMAKETTPEYESALRRARSSAEKGDFEVIERVLRPFSKYQNRDPELKELLSFID